VDREGRDRASSPDATVAELTALAPRYPEEALGNAALALLALEDPEGYERVVHAARLALAERAVESGLKALDERPRWRFLIDCAARVLPLFEARRPEDGRPGDALLVARRFADGAAPREELRRAAEASAEAVAGARFDDIACAGAQAAAYIVDLVYASVRDKDDPHYGLGAAEVARAAAYAAGTSGARRAELAEREWQAEHIRHYLGETEAA
jgi:hypothetical protein